MKIDAHQHFWKYNPAEHTWMTDEMPIIKHDFFPCDLKPLLSSIGFDGCIAVQARQNLEETDWLLQLAAQYDFVKGVVGWVDLRSSNIKKVLSKYSANKKLVGVRHVLHDEPDDDFMLQPSFINGIAALKEFNLTYDLLLFPKHLPIAVQLVRQFGGQPFVIDHIAKPFIKDKLLHPWESDMKAIAKFQNVYCKLSGMVTEANWNTWKKDDFNTYLDIVFNAFGPERLMLGSDWPVCTLSARYQDTMSIVIDFTKQLSPDEHAAILGGNCARFYGIDTN